MSSHTAQTELKLIGKLIVEGDIACQTGLHIGAGKGSLEIGGADNPVVKDSLGRPYIPGSSLRGRIRALLEQATGMAPAEFRKSAAAGAQTTTAGSVKIPQTVD